MVPRACLSHGVEFEDADLHDSVRGDDGAYRHDDVRHGPRTGSARPPVDHRDDDEQDELFRVDEAGGRVERKDDGDQCDAGVGDERPEYRRRVWPLVPDDHHGDP